MRRLIDAKPTSSKVVDTKPTVGGIDSSITDKLYTVNIAAGEWMGFLNFTYPFAITGIITNKEGGH
jgi:hypothetical protein